MVMTSEDLDVQKATIITSAPFLGQVPRCADIEVMAIEKQKSKYCFVPK